MNIINGNENQPLIQVVYTSMVTQSLDDTELLKILDIARANNKKDQITGLLLFRNGMFMQVVEGPKNNVTELLARIKSDRRHRDVLVIYENEIKRRDFPKWEMAFTTDPNNQIEGLSDYLRPYGSIDEDKLKHGPVRMLLSRFKQINLR